MINSNILKLLEKFYKEIGELPREIILSHELYERLEIEMMSQVKYYSSDTVDVGPRNNIVFNLQYGQVRIRRGT